MKSAEEYIDISKLAFKSNLLKYDIIKEWIKQAQHDAIDETCKICAENARIDEYMNVTSDNSLTVVIDKSSILQVADKLKQEIG